MDHDVNSVHHNGPDPVVGPMGHIVSEVGLHRRASVNGSMVSGVYGTVSELDVSRRVSEADASRLVSEVCTDREETEP